MQILILQFANIRILPVKRLFLTQWAYFSVNTTAVQLLEAVLY